MKRLLSSYPLIVLLVALVGCKGAQPNSSQRVATPISVETISVKTMPHYEIEREYVGQVRQTQRATLGFELGGKITAIYADVGDSVKKDTPLLQLDTQFIENENMELKAQQDEVVAQLALTNTTLRRQKQLKQKGFSADAEIDSLNSQVLVLKAKLARIEAALNNTLLKLKKSTIYAPYDGVIAQRYVSMGDVVNVGASTMTLLSSAHQEVVIGVPISVVPLAKQQSPITITVGEQEWTATLLNAAPNLDAHSRTVSLRYQLPENSHTLEKELAHISLAQVIQQPGAWVPISALSGGVQGLWNVLVVNNVEMVERRTVTVEHVTGTQAYVYGELFDQEKVISTGLHRVVAGQKVLAINTSEKVVNDDFL
ncbi:efflux RND transporter periplasmic adaptor subunit [Vibrio ulleungensis]|uniref:Efflux RND transporter periplasmic adaptor subunit n=1 Tax=Vibrio ulleungensis TaxID=2807619 RepID=A0ABS2HHT3_9VIBR|nr:efflux RND transporter periplasmic adaptor subunit [Vibrio ulleungensis]MBM7036231.1 efflux RND transporter periplasmic adaptor subunit [Vibrio ulleungensis]